MNSTDLVLSVLAIVFAVGALGRSFSAAGVAGAGRGLARRVGLPLDAAVEPAVRARARRRLRFASIGALAAVVIADSLVLAGVFGDPSFSSWALIVGAVLLGAGGGSALGAMTLRTAAPDGVRVARAREVTLADYLPASERIGAPIVIGVALVLETVVLTSPFWANTGAGAIPAASYLATVAITLLGAVALVAFEVLGRRLIAQPQPAGSPLELAWDDALRSVAVRDLATAPIAAGLYGVVLGGAPVVFIWINFMSTAGSIALAIYFALIIAVPVVIAIAVAVTRPQRHFLRRLWPEFITASASVEAAS